MIQNGKVLTQEANSISLVSARRTTTQEDYLTIAERAIPVSTMEQTWISEVGEVTPVGRTTPRLANIFVKIVNWLNYLGSGKIDESRLEARHNIHHNVKINGIRF
jgi:hypothetical protein